MGKIKKNLVIVSGLAGSGKTVAVHALEDLGYYCIDNLPAILLESFTHNEVLSHIKADHIALALDSRDLQTPQAITSLYEQLNKLFHIQILYLESSHEIILKRFRETRRLHPLTFHSVDSMNLQEAIDLDEKTLLPIKALANRVLDTSDLFAHTLKGLVYHEFAPSDKSKHVFLNFVSFGFKYGIPSDLDTVFDVRCFKNPHYDPKLRELTGANKLVKESVLSDENVEIFIKKVTDLIQFFYPLYQKEGKRYFAIGIGCTGGKHRSVVIVEELAKIFRSSLPLVGLEHRHIHRNPNK